MRSTAASAPHLQQAREALSVAYGAGLGSTDVAALRICNVDSERMSFVIERGKGGGIANAMLSPRLRTLQNMVARG